MNNYQKELETAINIAQKAGSIMLQYFDTDQEVEYKDRKSSVTIADKLINTMVIEKLKESFPEDGVIGEEESTAEYGTGRRWICDPIDGTAGYTWGTPTSMFSLALIIDGTPVLGVAYDPFLDKMYTAVIGGKSFCNEKELKVSDTIIEEGIVAVNGSIRSFPEKNYYQNLREQKSIRLATFSGLVYKAVLVAKGRLVGFVGPAFLHDVAAIHLIIENAGGKITTEDGALLDYSKPFKGVVVVSNGVVHEKLVEYCK